MTPAQATPIMTKKNPYLTINSTNGLIRTLLNLLYRFKLVSMLNMLLEMKITRKSPGTLRYITRRLTSSESKSSVLKPK